MAPDGYKAASVWNEPSPARRRRMRGPQYGKHYMLSGNAAKTAKERARKKVGNKSRRRNRKN